MTAEEIIANKRYHTCERCKYRDTLYGDYPCNECVYGDDNRKDHWEYRVESEDEKMNIIDVAEIKKAVKDNQLVFFTKELCSRTFIFCKDTQTEECACVGEIKAESEE